MDKNIDTPGRRWQSFAIAGGALLAAPGAAEAAVITTSNVNFNVTVTGINGDNAAGFPVDLNNDGIIDFGLIAVANGTGGNAVAIFPKGCGCKSNMTAKTGGLPDALTAGALVNSSLTFKPYSAPFLVSTKNGNVGNWPNDITQFRYVGVYFEIPDPNQIAQSTYHYGWIGLSAQLGSASMSVCGFAYEDQPDTGLAVAGCSDESVPEPSSLALFAIGAAGVLALKARRRSSARTE